MQNQFASPSVDSTIDLWEASHHDWTFEQVLAQVGGDSQVAEQAWAEIQKLIKANKAIERGMIAAASLHCVPLVNFEDLRDITVRVDFKKKAPIGSGGLGIVAAYNDPNFHRDVAVKFVKSGKEGAIDVEKLLRHEAEITARLDHPGVPPVYAYGETEHGSPFFAMRYVRGESLDCAITRLHQSWGNRPANQNESVLRDLLRHVASICNVVGYAHERGVVHRDLKPENVRVDRHGEVIVLDWGVAALVRPDEVSDAPNHSIIELSGDDKAPDFSGGTPPYMSPETWLGKPANGSNDIYAIGVILYQCLSGRRPIETSGSNQYKEKHCSADYIDIDTATQKLGKFPGRHDLGAVVRKAMAIDPANRYKSAVQIAGDIYAVLSDQSISIRTTPVSTRFARLIRRQRTAAFISVLALTLLSLVATILSGLTIAENKKRVHAEAVANQAATKASTDRDVLLSTMADFAADQVAGELASRYLLLHQIANAPIVVDGLDSTHPYNRDDYRELLNNFLIRIAENGSAVTRSESIWIQDAQGYQIAKHPKSDSIGKRFDHRHYFHGNGEDEIPSNHSFAITQRPVLSNVYQSSTEEGSYRIAMTFPIRASGSEKIAGIVGMSVELHHLASLRTGRSLPGIVVTLADWRSYTIDSKLRVGAIIQSVEDKFSEDESPATKVDFLPGSLLAIDVDENGRWLGDAPNVRNHQDISRTAISPIKWRRFDHDLSPLNFKLPPIKIIVQRERD